MSWVVVALLSLPFSAAEGRELQRYEYRQIHMGTEFRLTFYAPDRATGMQAAEAAFARVEHLDRMMSDFREDSELSLVNRNAYAAPVVVSPELFAVLLRSREIWAATDGAFDVTVGPLVQAWRQARREGRAPEPSEIEAVHAFCGMQRVLLNQLTRSVRFAHPQTRIDLGAIGKGFAADEVVKTLARMGIERALIDAGGDIVAGDAPPGRDGWKVEIAGAGHALNLRRRAAATSGDRYQRLDEGGRRFSHILDPRTGRAIEKARQVTVLAPDGSTADALATAFSVLTPEEGRRIVREFEDAEALFFEPEKHGNGASWRDGLDPLERIGNTEFGSQEPGVRSQESDCGLPFRLATRNFGTPKPWNRETRIGLASTPLFVVSLRTRAPNSG